MNSVSFFMGANTPDGFVSLFNNLYSPEDGFRVFIIKGGPGTGKSSLMKKAAAYAEDLNYTVERIFCSSDPSSLDAVIISELKVAMADGTSPHAIEPRYPGVCETIINLGDCWDKSKLANNKNEIIRTAKLNSSHHKQCVRYLKAAGITENETVIKSSVLFNKEKADRFIERLVNNYITKTDNDKGLTRHRFLSAVTPEGVYMHYNSILSMCNKTLCLKDNYSAASRYIIRKLADIITESGIDMIKCFNPLNPSTAEHIILPNCGLCIFTDNSYHPAIDNNNHTINCYRFYDINGLKEIKNSISFLRKAKDEFIKEASSSLKEAKKTHDLLESYYIAAMDFSKVAEIEKMLINDIF